MRLRLMGALNDTLHANVLVDIHLSEGDWEQAIDLADQAGYWGYRLVEKVADAVLPHHPDWVIQTSRRQAEGLIDKKKSKYYATAARWLGKAKQAYQITGRDDEWRVYLDELKNTYSRRPALQAQLRGL